MSEPNPITRLNAALEGRYRIESELGEGGMATVYLADDLRHGRRVAIKFLDTGLVESLGDERFTREIEIAARLNHPNILALHDSGEVDGRRFFVMPFIEGESLRHRLERDTTLPLAEACRIVGEVAGALHYAHKAGVVHRDIKPENILFQAGHAMVCDFGIALAVSGTPERLTRTGLTVGTLQYMSPEQLEDEDTVDRSTDVYALGCVLHEMLSGAPPFRASTRQAAIAKKLVGEAPDLIESDSCPHTVVRVVQRSLARSPGDRFPTTQEMAAELTRATGEVAIREDTRRRLRTRLASSVAAVAVLAAAAWMLTLLLGQPRFERIAVLPLLSDGNGQESEYFVQGIHEDLCLELQRAGIRVINPASVRRYAGSTASLQEIAEELQVDGVIQGSAGLLGRQVSIELLLVDPESSELVWSRSFESEERDVRGLLGSVTQAVAVAVGRDLDDETIAGLEDAPQVDEVIYEALLQGRFERFKLTADALDRSQSYYELALSRDSTVVEAWLGLAAVWNFRAQEGFVSANEAADLSAPLIARAESLDPELSVNAAETALQLTWPRWREGRWLEAEEAFAEALNRDPSDAVTRAYYALLLLYLGQRDEAERQTEWAAVQAPDEPLVQGLHGQALNALHRSEDAEEALTRARRFEPDAPILLSTLRTTYHLQGREADAVRMWRDSYRASGDEGALAALNRGYEGGGYEAALQAVAELFIERSATQRVTPWQIGTLYTRAGMTDEAIRYLEEAVDEGDPNAPYLSVDAIFDPLRDDSRFQRLVGRLRLPV
jgi:TolB-like protein/tRNA A-37 threonylcarbamoyl transferase component Bud32